MLNHLTREFEQHQEPLEQNCLQPVGKLNINRIKHRTESHSKSILFRIKISLNTKLFPFETSVVSHIELQLPMKKAPQLSVGIHLKIHAQL